MRPASLIFLPHPCTQLEISWLPGVGCCFSRRGDLKNVVSNCTDLEPPCYSGLFSFGIIGRSSGLGQGTWARRALGRLQCINRYGGISASSQQYSHIHGSSQMSALTLEIRQKEEAKRRAWGTLQQGFVCVFFSFGKRYSPQRLIHKSHWATASHRTTAYCKGQALVFPRPVQSRQAREKAVANGFWKASFQFLPQLTIMVWEGHNKRPIHLSWRWAN